MRFRIAAVILAGLATASTPALASHSWGGYHWARTTSGNFTLQLRYALADTSTWGPILQGTSGCTIDGGLNVFRNVATNWALPEYSGFSGLCAWTDERAATGDTTEGTNPLRTSTMLSAASPKRCPATSGVVVVCDASYGNNGWLGLASIWLSGKHITAGTAKMNDSYMASGTYGTPAWRTSVMCQEVGHTFGLGHQSENFSTDLDTCMDYYRGSPNLYPDRHDYSQLFTIYNHTDLTSTLASGTSTARREAAFPPGAGLRRAGHGDNVWVEDLPNGLRRLVHVRWADESIAHGPPEGA